MSATHLRTALLPLALATAAAVAVAGCHWTGYAKRAATHAELLERLAVDARDAAVLLGRAPTGSDLTRLHYPLERAERFVEISRRRVSGKPSLARFEALVAAYRGLLEHLEGLHVPGGGELPHASREETARLTALVEKRARAVLGALARE